MKIIKKWLLILKQMICYKYYTIKTNNPPHLKTSRLLHKLKPNQCVCGCSEPIAEAGKTSIPFYLPFHRYYCFLMCKNCDGRSVPQYSMTMSGAVRKAVKEWNRRMKKAKKTAGRGQAL